MAEAVPRRRAGSQNQGAAHREAIMRAVVGQPGINKRQLAAAVGLSWTTTHYHVNILRAQGRIQAERTGWATELYAGSVPWTHRRMVRALHDTDSVALLQAVALLQDRDASALAAHLGWSRKTLRSFADRLVEDGLLVRTSETPVAYRVVPQPDIGDHASPSAGSTLREYR